MFGTRIEDDAGHVIMLAVFLLSGISGDLLNAQLDPSRQIPSVGASGAIAGLMGAYLVLRPKQDPVVVWFGQHVVPAFVYLAYWIGFNLVLALVAYVSGHGTGVDWLAHLGGFLVGAALSLALRSTIRDRQVKLARNSTRRQPESLMKYPGYPGVIPARLTTSRHFGVSSAMRFASSSGELPTAVMPIVS